MFPASSSARFCMCAVFLPSPYTLGTSCLNVVGLWAMLNTRFAKSMYLSRSASVATLYVKRHIHLSLISFSTAPRVGIPACAPGAVTESAAAAFPNTAAS